MPTPRRFFYRLINIEQCCRPSAANFLDTERNHEARLNSLHILNQQHYQRSDGKSTHGFRSWELSDWFCSRELSGFPITKLPVAHNNFRSPCCTATLIRCKSLSCSGSDEAPAVKCTCKTYTDKSQESPWEEWKRRDPEIAIIYHHYNNFANI